jgi:hypothetical protein
MLHSRGMIMNDPVHKTAKTTTGVRLSYSQDVLVL